MKRKIYFIYMPGPTLGRSPFLGAGGGLFAYYRENHYLSALNNYLETKDYNWTAKRDDSESDIEQLIKNNAEILICAPGLRFQFYRNGFSKNKIIYLSTMEYINNDITRVVNKIREIESET